MAVATVVSPIERTMQLEAEAARLVGVVAVAEARLVEIIDEADRDGHWEGHRSVVAWAALKLGLAPGHARRLVRAARALRTLPVVRAVFREGRVTADHVAVLVERDLTPEREVAAVQLAEVASVTQLRRGLRHVPLRTVDDEAATAEAPTADAALPAAEVRFGDVGDGWWEARLRLPTPEGALVAKAIEAGRDAVFRDRNPDAAADAPPEGVTWADGLVRMAERSLDALDPATRAGRSPSDRFQVHVHHHVETGATELHLGPAVVASAARLMACDASVTAWVDDDHHTLAMGRSQRIADRRVRRAVEQRDGGCAVPGCEQRRWLVVHHIRHWQDGGPTDTANLVALCGHHHRAVHAGELAFSGNPDRGQLVTRDRKGRLLDAGRPEPPRGPPDIGGAYRSRSGERARWRWA